MRIEKMRQMTKEVRIIFSRKSPDECVLNMAFVQQQIEMDFQLNKKRREEEFAALHESNAKKRKKKKEKEKLQRELAKKKRKTGTGEDDSVPVGADGQVVQQSDEKEPPTSTNAEEAE